MAGEQTVTTPQPPPEYDWRVESAQRAVANTQSEKEALLLALQNVIPWRPKDRQEKKHPT